MKKPFLVLIGAAVLLAIVGITVVLLTNKESVPTSPSGNLFGEAADVPPELLKEMVTISLADGTQTQVPTFIKEEQPEVASSENGFEVAGTAEASFHILYFPQQSYFLVSLLSEPLGEARLAAERELRAQLGMTDERLCAINAEVRTSSDVNETFAGRDLGLSFCPSAVQLP